MESTDKDTKVETSMIQADRKHGGRTLVSAHFAVLAVVIAFVCGFVGRQEQLGLCVRKFVSSLRPQSAEQSALEWWKTRIIYQIYPRSFMDSNGDGIGDLKGITSRLGYLQDLNVGAIWLSPFFESPMADFGYDLSNQTKVDLIFGTIDDFDELLREAHARGLRVILDYIPNHTSDQHPWFVRSRKSSSPDNPFRDYYVWHDGKVDGTGTRSPPNNWRSFFSGSAWEFSTERQQFYLHQYLSQQPDLNWRHPDVRREMEAVLRFWLDRGVDGFRVDAVQTLYEADVSLDEPRSFRPGVTQEEHGYLRHIYTQNQEETHEVIRSWRAVLDEYTRRDGKQRFMVVEVYDEDIQQVVKFYQSGADMAFYFDLLQLNRSCGGACIQRLVSRLLDNLPDGAWPNFVLGNHDNKRIATKIGAEKVNALNTLLLLLPGTPTTYQGEELGQENIEVRYEDTQDPFGRFYGPDRYREVSRDPERSPMQWSADYQGGFTTAAKPWLPLHPMYAVHNVQSQRNAKGGSHLQLYQDLALLREEVAFQIGKFEYVVVNENIFSFVRRSPNSPAYLVVLNFGDEISAEDYSGAITGDTGEIVLTTHNSQHYIYETGQLVRLERVVLSPGQGLVIKLV